MADLGNLVSRISDFDECDYADTDRRRRRQQLLECFIDEVTVKLAFIPHPAAQVAFAIEMDVAYASLLRLEPGWILRRLVSVERFVDVTRASLATVSDVRWYDVLVNASEHELGARFNIEPGELRRQLTETITQGVH